MHYHLAVSCFSSVSGILSKTLSYIVSSQKVMRFRFQGYNILIFRTLEISFVMLVNLELYSVSVNDTTTSSPK